VALKNPVLLICDDDRMFFDTVKLDFEGEYRCVHAPNSDAAIKLLSEEKVDAILLDVSMRSPTEGLKAIPRILECEPDLPIIMCSGHTQFEIVRDAMRFGALDYFAKSSDISELKQSIARALNQVKITKPKGSSRENLLLGRSPAILNLREKIKKIKIRNFNVLITGEMGSGKEVVARLLRRELEDGSLEPFQAIDSSTIQSSMAESLLFGHEKGAFTGADKASKGMFEEADGGIVYFDEISNMPLEIQAKLLRVLQEKEIKRVGSSKTISVNFRVVAASNQDLNQMVSKGQFKADLLDRINVIPIRLPRLSERKEDIPELTQHFFEKFQAPAGMHFSASALESLMKYDWPGNVRELGNLIAYLVTLSAGQEIQISDLPEKFLKESAATEELHPFHGRKDEFEKKFLEDTYSRMKGNVSKMAEELKISRSHLYEKLKRYGIK